MLSEQDYEETLYQLKSKGFSDAQIARNFRTSADKIRKTRIKENILPSYKLVDTCSAEFEAKTPYCYSTYDHVNEIQPIEGKKVIILGGGPNRIGQGIEFDYCCVQAVFGLKELGYKTIMINCIKIIMPIKYLPIDIIKYIFSYIQQEQCYRCGKPIDILAIKIKHEKTSFSYGWWRLHLKT